MDIQKKNRKPIKCRKTLQKGEKINGKGVDPNSRTVFVRRVRQQYVFRGGRYRPFTQRFFFTAQDVSVWIVCFSTGF